MGSVNGIPIVNLAVWSYENASATSTRSSCSYPRQHSRATPSRMRHSLDERVGFPSTTIRPPPRLPRERVQAVTLPRVLQCQRLRSRELPEYVAPTVADRQYRWSLPPKSAAAKV